MAEILDFFNNNFLLIILIMIILPLFAQSRVRKTYTKYAQVENQKHITGEQAARQIMQANGINDVKIEVVNGTLTDHYDPRANTVRLSNDIYNGTSISAVAIAAHEIGHVIQHKKGYAMMNLRKVFAPIASFGSSISMFSILFGLITASLGLFYFGIFGLVLVLIFQLITLPVEFNASTRAKQQLVTLNLVGVEEKEGVSRVLNAAAWTYIVAAFVTLLNILRLIALARRR